MKPFLSFIAIFFVSSLLFAKDLPDGYKNIHLGMSVEETKTELIKNPDFGYKGDRDVSLLPGKTETLIETDAERVYSSNFLRRCWFQFYNDYLYIITININPSRIDYYSIFTTLKDKYGEPTEINPQYSCWKNDEITMYLEKNLSIKYISNETMDLLKNSVNIEKSTAEITQQMFLDEL